MLTLDVLLGTRLMVGQQILDLYVGVRLLRPQPTICSWKASITEAFFIALHLPLGDPVLRRLTPERKLIKSSD